MKAAPSLADAVYRASFRNETNYGWKSNQAMRRALEGAQRFIADERMASFMAELANEAFLKVGVKGKPFSVKLLDSLRVQSRVPHEAIWIEYPLRPYQHRSAEIRGSAAPIDAELPAVEGWLIQQHPQIETAAIMHLFNHGDAETKSDDGFTAWTFPLAFAWCCDESPLPWRRSIVPRDSKGAVHPIYNASSFLAGLPGYARDNVGCVLSPLIDDPKREYEKIYQELFTEWTGILRRVWALLATIDNLPIGYGQVRQSKGFLARGRIRKYLNHHTITLNIPARQDTRVLARKVVAAAHRARHWVRAHWRDDWRNPPSKKCDPHIWQIVDDDADVIRCEQCGGRQFHIHKHERGDARLGWVIPSYALRHPEEPA